VESPLLFDAWIERAIPNYNDRVMLYQYIAYSMTLRTNEQKFLLICGPGGTGKSTLLKLIEEIIGASNVSGISLQGLQERFAPAGLFLKQANICADIPLTALTEIDMIKKLTGEDTVSADRKFKSPFSFRSYARLFFSANSIPYVDEKTNALYRRMLILKMDNAPDTVDQGLYEKLRAEIPNIITKLMEEIYCSAGAVDISDNCREAVKEAHKDSDSVVAFLDDRCTEEPDARTDRRTLYDAYKNYCYSEGRKELSPNGFYKALINKGYKQIKGKTRDFVGLKVMNIIPFIHHSTADSEEETAVYGR
jgi:P4 family phage/plasmid primase-like protien